MQSPYWIFTAIACAAPLVAAWLNDYEDHDKPMTYLILAAIGSAAGIARMWWS